jgi:hypothetical protein
MTKTYDDPRATNLVTGIRHVTIEGFQLHPAKDGIGWIDRLWKARLVLKQQYGERTERPYEFDLTLGQLKEIRAKIDDAIEARLVESDLRLQKLKRAEYERTHPV